MAFASLLRRKSRMLIALLAIVVGATILSGLVTVYIDVPRQMGAEFRNYGANVIFTSKDGTALTIEEINDGLSNVNSSQIVGMTPYRYETVRINQTPVTAAGTDMSSVLKTSPYWSVDGEIPDKDGEILIGATVAQNYNLQVEKSISVTFTPEEVAEEAVAFDNGDEAAEGETSTSDVVLDNYIDFKITGILNTGGAEENYIYMSLEDLEELTQIPTTISLAEVSISASGSDLTAVVGSINQNSENVSAKVVKRVTASETTVLGKLQALILLVTIIVLALTMITVATTMTASVTERRREIGLKKALGALDGEIIKEFMGEQVLLGGFGGLIGTILGFLFAQLISVNVFSSSIVFRPVLLPLTIVISMAVTAVACLIPIRNATEIEPALVLKGE